jgi:hypothetical protein
MLRSSSQEKCKEGKGFLQEREQAEITFEVRPFDTYMAPTWCGLPL